VLTDSERQTLDPLERPPKSAQSLVLRSRIVLVCADPGTDVVIAKRLGLDRNTVGQGRNRFLALPLDGLHHEPRPGTPAPLPTRSSA